jgi:hypothetical protein
VSINNYIENIYRTLLKIQPSLLQKREVFEKEAVLKAFLTAKVKNKLQRTQDSNTMLPCALCIKSNY